MFVKNFVLGKLNPAKRPMCEKLYRLKADRHTKLEIQNKTRRTKLRKDLTEQEQRRPLRIEETTFRGALSPRLSLTRTPSLSLGHGKGEHDYGGGAFATAIAQRDNRLVTGCRGVA